MSFPLVYTRHTATDDLTFFLSLMELFPRTMILHPVSASNCLAVSPRGPRILPTKLYCRKRERKKNKIKFKKRERENLVSLYTDT